MEWTHIVPLNDLIEHCEDSTECPCNPEDRSLLHAGDSLRNGSPGMLRRRYLVNMKWTDQRPTASGFYYWQNSELRSISPFALRVVDVSKYKNRDGYRCATLTENGNTCSPVFSCDLGNEPIGWWAGPLPNPID